MTLELPGGSTIGQLVQELARAYSLPASSPLLRESIPGQWRPYRFTLNGRLLTYDEDLGTPLAEGDAVTIFMPMVGG